MAAMTTFSEETMTRMLGVARMPEALYGVILATADEAERRENHQTAADLRVQANNLVPLFGDAADQAWSELSWLERFKHRGRQAEWKQALTEALSAASRRSAAREIAETN